MVTRVGSADSMERRAANIRPSITVPKNLTPNNVARNQAASQARYEGMGRTMAPSGTAVPLPSLTPSGDFSGQTQYGEPTPSMPPPAQPDLSEDTLRKTPEYMARERALAEMLDSFRTRQSTERTRFDTGLQDSFRDLGFDPTSRAFDLGELMAQGQRETISGRAYNDLRNDFAGRGMLQSGAYQAKRGTLSQRLIEQATELEKRGITFGEDQTAALVAQEEQAKAQRNAALEEARQAVLSRFAMGG